LSVLQLNRPIVNKPRKTEIWFILFFIFTSVNIQAQVSISGLVLNNKQQPVAYASVSLEGTHQTQSNARGHFKFEKIEAGTYRLSVSCIGYKKSETLLLVKTDSTYQLSIQLEEAIQSLDEISVKGNLDKISNLNRIEISQIKHLPSVGGDIESLLKSMAGVYSNNELSSQYSVRGGNFDENLVYVNDIEIYKPFLVRTGQQEGLSFINPDMVSSVKFSAGCFEAKYGDKMSSVLDVNYKTPEKTEASATIGLLGGSASLAGVGLKQKLSYIAGFRHKTTRYLLNTLETEGDYQPSFSDVQCMLNYKFNNKFSASYLGNYAMNKYNFIPQTRSTTFGTLQEIYNLRVYYEGAEHDKYSNYLSAASFVYEPTYNLQLKLIGSYFSSYEQECFDIEGSYLINELDNTIGSDTYGDSILNLGFGSFLNHARNYLHVDIFSLSHSGTLNKAMRLKWGLAYKSEKISDRLNEWNMIDSAGYSAPYYTDSIVFADAYRSRQNQITHRFSGFLQSTFTFRNDSAVLYLTPGIRFSHWSYTGETILSPRVVASYNPHWKKEIIFYLAGGIYYQSPFYREYRYANGSLNQNIKSQRSLQISGGCDYFFMLWSRPFKLSSEAYYKHLDNLIPYYYDNLRIRYAAENKATGYAVGLDTRISGEFVKGTESWASLSIMKTRENIIGDYYTDDNGTRHEIGSYPRPTDQLINFSLFFQDYFPSNPSIKVHLMVLFGSGLPGRYPDKTRYDKVFRIDGYKRIDIGFSKDLYNRPYRTSFGLSNLWLGVEVLNMFGFKNIVSYQWLQTVDDQAGLSGWYAVPNYLTGRRFNIKLSASF
jgi:hypothetical protein